MKYSHKKKLTIWQKIYMITLQTFDDDYTTINILQFKSKLEAIQILYIK